MKRSLLIAVLSVFAAHSYSQGMYGIEGGICKATLKKSKITPAFEGYYLQRLSRSIYMGVSLNFQRYSFVYTTGYTPASVSYGDVLNVSQKASYLFVTPKFDLGIGYRKYWHANIAAGPGMFLGGEQLTTRFEPFWTVPSLYGRDTVTSNTGFNIPQFRLQYRIGISRRITTLAYWNIMVSANYTYLTGNISVGKPNLQTSAVCFTIGVMHKYPQELVEY